MAEAKFAITTHRIEGQHKREYPQGLTTDHATPRIVVKQYSPIENRPPVDRSITIVAAGGLGFIKEVYEPFFEDLCAELKQRGVQVRNIWMADMYAQGASAIENAETMGNDPSWWDHSRDLLHMINVFRDEMQDPLIGIGHSMGAAQMYLIHRYSLATLAQGLTLPQISAHLSTLHPRLFASLILIEPQIHDGVSRASIVALFQVVGRRREHWRSRAEAEKSMRRNPFFANWNARAIDRLVKFSVVDDRQSVISTTIDGASQPKVRTSTSRSMELALLARPNLDGVGTSPKIPKWTTSVPDLDPKAKDTYPFYRSEPTAIFRLLPMLRPSVLWVCSAQSSSSPPAVREDWLNLTGTGIGGSGGASSGRVKMHIIPGDRHTLPMDDMMGEVVRISREWLQAEMRNWQQTHGESSRRWVERSTEDKQALRPVFRDVIGEFDVRGEESLEDFIRRMPASSKL